MKRYGNLYERIISIPNLELADAKARKGKLRSYGVKQHDRNRAANIATLHKSLKEKTFKTSDYTVFKIYEPKERVIHRLPYYPDRIVHHAIMNVLEPIWLRTFTRNTYSCIKRRGIEGCARQVERIIKRYEGSNLFCLKMDIKKFYPSIKPHISKDIIRRKIKDKDLLWLLDNIIDSSEGLPIGNYISQYLANLILAYMMHYINEEMPEEIRRRLSLDKKPRLDSTEYADDITLFSDSKEVLHEARRIINAYLSEELELQMKENWQVFPIANNRFDEHGRALDYVGYKFYRHQKLIRKSTKQNLCKAALKLYREKPDAEPWEVKHRMAPWLGWAKHSNSIHLLQTILKQEHYETCILRQRASSL